MNVKLVSITKPLIDDLTPEEFIAYCARVSNPSNQLNTATAPRLLKYCIDHGHWSVFEQVSFSVEIKTSRAIAAQMLRHKSFSFQEFSQRYSEATTLEPIELRKQAEKNRQSSTEILPPDPRVEKHLAECLDLYQTLVFEGVAKECARFLLPLTTSTTLYMSGTVRSWIHYLMQRCSQHAQKEHRIPAESIRDIFQLHFPVIASIIIT